MGIFTGWTGSLPPPNVGLGETLDAYRMPAGGEQPPPPGIIDLIKGALGRLVSTRPYGPQAPIPGQPDPRIANDPYNQKLQRMGQNLGEKLTGGTVEGGIPGLPGYNVNSGVLGQALGNTPIPDPLFPGITPEGNVSGLPGYNVNSGVLGQAMRSMQTPQPTDKAGNLRPPPQDQPTPKPAKSGGTSGKSGVSNIISNTPGQGLPGGYMDQGMTPNAIDAQDTDIGQAIMTNLANEEARRQAEAGRIANPQEAMYKSLARPEIDEEAEINRISGMTKRTLEDINPRPKAPNLSLGESLATGFALGLGGYDPMSFIDKMDKRRQDQWSNDTEYMLAAHNQGVANQWKVFDMKMRKQSEHKAAVLALAQAKLKSGADPTKDPGLLADLAYGLGLTPGEIPGWLEANRNKETGEYNVIIPESKRIWNEHVTKAKYIRDWSIKIGKPMSEEEAMQAEIKGEFPGFMTNMAAELQRNVDLAYKDTSPDRAAKIAKATHELKSYHEDTTYLKSDASMSSMEFLKGAEKMLRPMLGETNWGNFVNHTLMGAFPPERNMEILKYLQQQKAAEAKGVKMSLTEQALHMMNPGVDDKALISTFNMGVNAAKSRALANKGKAVNLQDKQLIDQYRYMLSILIANKRPSMSDQLIKNPNITTEQIEQIATMLDSQPN